MRSIKQIIELIKQHCGVEKDKDVAKVLKMNPPALSNHKRRGTIPFDDLASFCHEEGLPLDWLLNAPDTGESNNPRARVEDFTSPLGGSGDDSITNAEKKEDEMYRLKYEALFESYIEQQNLIISLQQDLLSLKGGEVKKPQPLGKKKAL